MNTHFIRLIRKSEQLEYKNLLLKSHAESKSFFAHPQSANWDRNDDIYYPLGIFEKNHLVSCMRLDWIASLDEFNQRLKVSYQQNQVTIPCAYLTKAGTDPLAQNKGYNLLLRYHCLLIALSWKVKEIFGTMVEGSPRVFSMKEIGYEFHSAEGKWDDTFVSSNPPLVAKLDLIKKGSFALDSIKTQLGDFLTNCKVQYDIANIKIRTPQEIKEILKIY